ncbi:hypothetical protein [Pseudomonas alvandae]|uniref:hypothetical protein n=1 Tax=Pseudomonas canavaninivorans TaxID=2842348 RepID=UPI003D65091D
MSDLPEDFSPKDAYLLGIIRSIQGLTAAVSSDPKMRSILEESLKGSLEKHDKNYDADMIRAYKAPIGATLHVIDQVNAHIASKKS